MKYYPLTRYRPDKTCKSILVATRPAGKTYEDMVSDGQIMAEFYVSGPISEGVAELLAIQYAEALKIADGNIERLFSNTFLATRHPK